MTKSGWAVRRAAQLPALGCPQSSRQRGRSPASPTAWQRGKGSQRGTHSRLGCPIASTVQVVHDETANTSPQAQEVGRR